MEKDTTQFGTAQNWFLQTFISPTKQRQSVFESEEVAALIKFASEKGIDTDDHLVRRLYFALLHFEEDRFFWGALGACIYILKRITDEAADHRFDPDKFRGWLTKMTEAA
jgi:hypothetical protein